MAEPKAWFRLRTSSEVIVGDIEDEHDDGGAVIVDKGDGVFVDGCQGQALDDVAEAMGSGFDVGEHGEDVDTIGGLIFAIIGRVPVRGEIIEALGHEFRVLDADPRRIKRVEVSPRSSSGSQDHRGAGLVIPPASR
ncbi:MAG: transporter associated domain-containing protein [Nitratireductor sp.]